MNLDYNPGPDPPYRRSMRHIAMAVGQTNYHLDRQGGPRRPRPRPWRWPLLVRSAPRWAGEELGGRADVAVQGAVLDVGVQGVGGPGEDLTQPSPRLAVLHAQGAYGGDQLAREQDRKRDV